MAEQKPALAYEELRDVIDLALWAGQLLLQYGAESHRIEETIHRLATGLGCDWADVLVSPSVILITTTSGGEFRTKTRRVVRIGVNLWVVSAVNRLSRRITAGELDRFQVRSELERISAAPPEYPRWLVVVMVGLSCASASQLMGASGDWTVFGLTFGTAVIAAIIRQILLQRHLSPQLITFACALAAGVLVGIAFRLNWSDKPEMILISAVLQLVPGVHLLTSVEDLIEGHIIMGIARGAIGIIVTLAIALGLLVAIRLMGISGL